MHVQRTFFTWIIFVVFSILLTGCAGNTRPSSFYMLRSLAEPEKRAPEPTGQGDLSLLLGPITLPVYLDRKQVVTLAGKHELVVDEFTRWAEPLQDNFYRVLVEDLSLLLNTPRVYAYDRRGSPPADFQIIMDVTRFESVAQGDAHLTVFWTIIQRESKKPIAKKSVFRAAAPSQDVVGVIEAQNETLTALSREIAGLIRSLHQ